MKKLSPEERFWSKVKKENACWLWTAGTSSGYGLFWLNGENYLAHRISWMWHNNLPLKAEMIVLHKCDIPTCVNPEHLVLGTTQDNVADRVSKGRSAFGARNGTYTHPETVKKGEANGRAILTEELVRAIRKEYSESFVSYHISAKKYGVSKSLIFKVVNYELWKDVK